MKEIEKKDMPEVSGGWTAPDETCFPPVTTPPEKDYPNNPGGPLINDPTCPDTAA
ncbi:MAG: hypothetical protein ABIR98_12800 [Usitatibacter sp.]